MSNLFINLNRPKGGFFINLIIIAMKPSPFRQILSTLLFTAVLCIYFMRYYGHSPLGVPGVFIVPFIHLFHGKKLAVKLLAYRRRLYHCFPGGIRFVWIAGKINKILDYIFIYNK